MEDGNNVISQNAVTRTHLTIVVFLVVTSCSGVKVCRGFREKNGFLHHERSSPTLTIKASLASEMSIHVHQTTWCHIPWHSNIYSHLRENLKPNLTINKLYGRLCLASCRCNNWLIQWDNSVLFDDNDDDDNDDDDDNNNNNNDNNNITTDFTLYSIPSQKLRNAVLCNVTPCSLTEFHRLLVPPHLQPGRWRYSHLRKPVGA